MNSNNKSTPIVVSTCVDIGLLLCALQVSGRGLIKGLLTVRGFRWIPQERLLSMNYSIFRRKYVVTSGDQYSRGNVSRTHYLWYSIY